MNMRMKMTITKPWPYKKGRSILSFLFIILFFINWGAFIRLRIAYLIPYLVFPYMYPIWILYTEMLLSLIGLVESFELLSAKKLLFPLVKILATIIVIVIVSWPR